MENIPEPPPVLNALPFNRQTVMQFDSSANPSGWKDRMFSTLAPWKAPGVIAGQDVHTTKGQSQSRHGLDPFQECHVGGSLTSCKTRWKWKFQKAKDNKSRLRLVGRKWKPSRRRFPYSERPIYRPPNNTNTASRAKSITVSTTATPNSPLNL